MALFAWLFVLASVIVWAAPVNGEKLEASRFGIDLREQERPVNIQEYVCILYGRADEVRPDTLWRITEHQRGDSTGTNRHFIFELFAKREVRRRISPFLPKVYRKALDVRKGRTGIFDPKNERGAPGFVNCNLPWLSGGCEGNSCPLNLPVHLVHSEAGSDAIYSSTCCTLGGLIGLTGKTESMPKQAGAKQNEESRDPSRIHHTLSSAIHRVRSVGHALLGDYVPILIFVSFGFAALAGEGAFRVFDYSNRKAKRKRFGWMLVGVGVSFGLACFILGVAGTYD